tara:strand:+ start:142 stop:465 length:324 start_codon:yes stop_codon:yes gene_type:complete
MIFLLSHEVMRELVTAKHQLGEEEVTNALWHRFCQEADINIISERSTWTISDLALKVKTILQEFRGGAYGFDTCPNRTTLVATTGKVVGNFDTSERQSKFIVMVYCQ